MTVVKSDRLVEVARDEAVALAPGTATFDLSGEYIRPSRSASAFIPVSLIAHAAKSCHS